MCWDAGGAEDAELLNRGDRTDRRELTMCPAIPAIAAMNKPRALCLSCVRVPQRLCYSLTSPRARLRTLHGRSTLMASDATLGMQKQIIANQKAILSKLR
jgi:hypothetical protein